MRINRYIALGGKYSRRDADKLVQGGHVYIGGKLIKELWYRVEGGTDVYIDGEKVIVGSMKLWKFHKPRKCICSRSADGGRRVIYDYLPEEMKSIKSIGRLDYHSEGLLLLTNDGQLAREYELPSNKYEREYKVSIAGRCLTERNLQELRRGVTVKGIRYDSIRCRVDYVKGNQTWLRMVLREGKNREIRKILDYFDCSIRRLIRIRYGKFRLGDIKSGSYVETKL